MKKTRIFLIEDNRILLERLAKLIAKPGDMILVGTARDTAAIIDSIKKAKPHILLVGTSINGERGAVIAEHAKAELPDVKIIGMGLTVSGGEIGEFIKAGATGYVMKDAGASEVLETIRWVARETRIILPAVPESLLTRIEGEPSKFDDGPKISEGVSLTRREREIVQLIADSSTNKEIALRLNIATFTVKSHVHNILSRLGFHSRLQIARYALQRQPVPPVRHVAPLPFVSQGEKKIAV